MSSQEQKDALDTIQKDLDRILGKLDESDDLLKKLEDKFGKHQQKQEELEEQNEQLDQELDETNKVISKLQQENKDMEMKLSIGEDSSEILKEKLAVSQKYIEECEQQVKKLNEKQDNVEKKKKKNEEAMDKIKKQIEKVEQRVSAQIIRMGDMGKVTISDSSSAQVGGRPSKARALGYLSLFPLLEKANKTKLVTVAKSIGMKPKDYPLRNDLLVAIKLALHCKAGIIRHTRELKIVGKNLNVVEIQKMKTKKELCEKLDVKLGKISLRKIQKLL
jgi:DNA repair exonuclease SbcCD ATPase subunit